MPVEKCVLDKKPGYRWGTHGACYLIEVDNDDSRKRAYAKAALQGRAIKRAQSMRGGMMETRVISKIFGAAVQLTPGDGGGVAYQWPSEHMRELTERAALAELRQYIASLGFAPAWATYVEGAVMDRFYAAFARQ